MIVAISELPRTRDTLLVRLMGASKTFRLAVGDARSLPLEALEGRLALPIPANLRLEVPAEPSKQTESDREFMMTTEKYEKWLGGYSRERGARKGVADSVLMVYRARFGCRPRPRWWPSSRARRIAPLSSDGWWW